MDTGRLVGGVLIIVVAAVLLYYLYDYMFNIGGIQKKGEIVVGPISTTVAADSTATSPVNAYPPNGDLSSIIFTGGEMSVSFWMYVTGLATNSLTKKHILHIGTAANGNNDNNVLGVFLGGASNNGLFVKVAATGENNGRLNLGTYANLSTTDLTEPCNISNIEFGRWVNVVVVLNNNTSDVYIDGKLSRSCVLKGQFSVPPLTGLKFHILQKSLSETTGTSNNPTTSTLSTPWSGSFAGLNFYNYALSPDEVYRIYFAGPSGSSGDLWSAIKSFFGAGQRAAAVFTSPA